MHYPVAVSSPSEPYAHLIRGLPKATATASSSVPSTSMSVAAGPGLRSCCETCAVSKLKCSKERPRCARCVKRGLNCTYALLKRAGRKPGQAQTSSRSRRRAPSSTGPSPPSGVTSTSTSTSSDMLEDLFGTSFDMTLDGFDAEITDSSRFHYDDLLGDHHSLPTFTVNPLFIHGLDGEQLQPIGDDDSHGMVDVPPLIHHASIEPRPLQTISMSDHDSQLLRTDRPDDVSCSCLAHVLSLFKQYSASSERLCIHQRVLKLDGRLENVSTQSIFSQNETALELLGGLLDCQCFQDGYLIVMIALIIFKILGWYAIVAQRTKSSPSGEGHILSSSHALVTAASSVVEEQISNPPATIRGFRLDSEDAERRTAQMILGELHRARQLIKKFASRLDLLTEKMQDADRTRVSAKGLCANITLPTSMLVYSQLETDLRSEWRALSAHVIDRLKKL